MNLHPHRINRSRFVTNQEYKHTLEAKAKISKGHLGRSTVTPEGREKIRAAKLGNKIWVGRKHTTKTIDKMRKSHKGHVNTPEHNAAIGRGQLGKKRSLETRTKIGDANRRRVFTPEMIERIKKAQQARWAKVRASKLSITGT